MLPIQSTETRKHQFQLTFSVSGLCRKGLVAGTFPVRRSLGVSWHRFESSPLEGDMDVPEVLLLYNHKYYE
jgi:hypothetical protein